MQRLRFVIGFNYFGHSMAVRSLFANGYNPRLVQFNPGTVEHYENEGSWRAVNEEASQDDQAWARRVGVAVCDYLAYQGWRPRSASR